MSIDYCHHCDGYFDSDETSAHYEHDETDAEVEKTETVRDLQAPEWPQVRN